MSSRTAHKLAAVVARGLHRLYKVTVSPFFGNRCRFVPPCSDYAMKAVEEHGALVGSSLAFRRILKCHPFHSGGFDPVPERCCGTPDRARDNTTKEEALL